jgi:hypothetical protein
MQRLDGLLHHQHPQRDKLPATDPSARRDRDPAVEGQSGRTQIPPRPSPAPPPHPPCLLLLHLAIN